MNNNDPWKWWKACAQTVVLFTAYMLIRFIIDPSTSLSRLPKQSYTDKEKVAEIASEELTGARKVLEFIKGE